MSELTPEQAYALAEIAKIETGIGSHLRVKFESKLDAIKAKMKRLGLMRDKVDHTLTIESYEDRRKRLGLNEMSPEEALEKLEREQAEWEAKQGAGLE